MLTIEDNNIKLTRGDTAYLNIELEGYSPLEGDTITLTVKKTVGSAAVFTTTVPLGEAIVIQPADTKDLEYGKYLYDIQINTNLGEVFTIIEKSRFELKEEITE